MSNSNETTLLSLFTSDDHARQAISELQGAGIPQSAIQTISGGNVPGNSANLSLPALQGLNLPAQDQQLLASGLRNGGTLVVVRTAEHLVDKAEDIFEAHNASKVDERTIARSPVAAVTGESMTGQQVIPVVQEELVVGKRRVERGGVRVFSRMVETPVEEQVTLREEHATFERHAVNRPISEAELNALQNQSIEIREMGEEAVVGKTARVVEEVHVGKDSTERTEQIRDTVRKTQVEVDQIAADAVDTTTHTKALGANKS